MPRKRRKETGSTVRWRGNPCQGKMQVNEVEEQCCALPEVWKLEHFQAAMVLVTPAKFLCKERSEQRLCSPSSSVNLACSTNLPQHSLLFEVINDVFNNSRGRVYTDLLGKAYSTHMPVSPKQSVNPPGVYLLGWPKLRAARGKPRRRKERGQPAPCRHCPCHHD